MPAFVFSGFVVSDLWFVVLSYGCVRGAWGRLLFDSVVRERASDRSVGRHRVVRFCRGSRWLSGKRARCRLGLSVRLCEIGVAAQWVRVWCVVVVGVWKSREWRTFPFGVGTVCRGVVGGVVDH